MVCVVTLAGCNQKEEAVTPAQPEANPICSAENLAGGWSQGEVTPEAQQALDFVLGQLNTAAKLKELLSVRTQVVNGLNYAIEFEMDNGEVWNTIVYRPLKGDMEMTRLALQGRICP
ncbi:2-oxoglutarate dehydrogenase [Vibrio sp. PID23_8]|uniref:cystatin domain-containing protein n=1 Tax=Vibrio sp. PID17_43 TaxID=1583451 RepID=UPI000BFFC018|nr:MULTISPECIES: cystatin domain-containing protein [unclassified Vibrio]PHJ40303.1 2-oxoglutarate dehydrogenase [Vibrio sp. PID17_43]RIZ51238.1 2-oxoglutarate dehydrogenase [Vibrio sp. PID23_8]